MEKENGAEPRKQRKNPRYRRRVGGDHVARYTPRPVIVYDANANGVANCARSATIIGESTG